MEAYSLFAVGELRERVLDDMPISLGWFWGQRQCKNAGVATYAIAGCPRSGPRARAIDSNTALLKLQQFTHRDAEHRAQKQAAWLTPQ